MTRFLLGVYFAIAVAFLVMPLVLLVPISLTDSQFLEFPPQRISMRWYREFFVDESWVGATLLSFKVGIGATAVALVVGTLASVAIVRGSFPGRRLIHALLVAPLIIPTVILALALFIVFLRWKLVDNVPALILAHAVVALPYVVLIVSSALRSFDTTLERAARVLGASPVRAFFAVTLPYLGPSMFASALLAFFASFDELIITLFVSGGLQTLPVRIWTDLMLRLDPTVAAAATMLIVVSVVGMAIAEYFRQRNVRRYGG